MYSLALAILCASIFQRILVTAKLTRNYTNSTFLDGSKERFKFSWRYDFNEDVLFVGLQVKATGWVGFGFAHKIYEMENYDVIIGKVVNGQGILTDRHTTGYMEPLGDIQQDYNMTYWEEANGTTTLEFYRKRITGDDKDIDLKLGAMLVVYAYHSTADYPFPYKTQHDHQGYKSVVILPNDTILPSNVTSSIPLSSATTYVANSESSSQLTPSSPSPTSSSLSALSSSLLSSSSSISLTSPSLSSSPSHLSTISSSLLSSSPSLQTSSPSLSSSSSSSLLSSSSISLTWPSLSSSPSQLSTISSSLRSSSPSLPSSSSRLPPTSSVRISYSITLSSSLTSKPSPPLPSKPPFTSLFSSSSQSTSSFPSHSSSSSSPPSSSLTSSLPSSVPPIIHPSTTMLKSELTSSSTTFAPSPLPDYTVTDYNAVTKVSLSVKIVNIKYEVLKDRRGSTYLKFKENFEKNMAKKKKVWKVRVTNLRRGSVIVDYDVIINSTSLQDVNHVINKIQEEVTSGKMGNFSVDPNYSMGVIVTMKVKPTAESLKSKDTREEEYLVIVIILGVTVGVLFIIATALIILLAGYKRKSNRSDSFTLAPISYNNHDVQK